MAGKRTASSELNHLNWDQEDEPEDAGEFKKASDDVLKRRVIKTAKRRNPISSGESSSKGVFGGFSGFATKAPPPSAAFSFLNNISKEKDTAVPVNGTSMFQKTNSSPDTSSVTNTDTYLAKLKGLNESVSNWIKNKVEENPFINLKPIFKDYEKYFEALEKEKVSTGNGTKGTDDAAFKSQLSSFVFKSPEQKPADAPALPATTQFSFGSSSSKNDKAEVPKPTFSSTSTDSKSSGLFSFANKEEETQKKPMFSYGSKESGDMPKFGFGATSTTATAPTFSFGSSPGTSTSSSGLTGATSSTSTFTFGGPGSKPFSFGNVAASSSSVAATANVDNKEEEEEPPKNEFTPVVEDGHVYTTRCKVFVKADGNFGDRGVGTLYLKPIPDSEKTQLIVRADTSLGNLLCNFILSKSIPTKRIGKKDVMLVCLPTPETKPPPVPVLLRVKSPEEADELLTELEKHKK